MKKGRDRGRVSRGGEPSPKRASLGRVLSWTSRILRNLTKPVQDELSGDSTPSGTTANLDGAGCPTKRFHLNLHRTL